jgi:hypothetical protein
LDDPDGLEAVSVLSLTQPVGNGRVIGSSCVNLDHSYIAGGEHERLANVTADDNRFTLAGMPLDASGKPVENYGNLTAARLQAGAPSDLLTEG